MSEVILMRGLPGSGKSTWISNEVLKSRRVISADELRTVGGEYRFDPRDNARIHDECLRAFARLMIDERPVYPVVVDNTNIATWEIAPYYRLAEAFGHKVTIIRIHCDPVVAFARNIHKVPLKRILKMADLLSREELPSWWNEEVIA